MNQMLTHLILFLLKLAINGNYESCDTMVPTISVSGRVTANVVLSDYPVANAKIYFNGIYESRTNSKGEFILNGILPGEYNIVITAEGFFSGYYTRRYEFDTDIWHNSEFCLK